MVAARWDEGCELVRADFGEGSCVGSLLAVPSPLPWTREHRAAQPRLFLRKNKQKKSLLKSIWLGADVLCLSSIEVSWSSANANDVRGEEAKILPRMSAVGLGRARRRTVAWLRCIAEQTGPGAA